MKIKKALVALLCLVMMTGLLPTAAFAADNILIVGGVTLSTSGYWKTDSNGVLTPSDSTDWTIHYNKTGDHELTLRGATINGSGTDAPSGAAIYSKDQDLILIVRNENTVTAKSDIAMIGIYMDTCNLKIKGDGLLNIHGGTPTMAYGTSVGLSAQNGNILITDTVSVNAIGNLSYTSSGITSNGDLTISTTGTVTATGKTYGIDVIGTLTVSSGTVIASSSTQAMNKAPSVGQNAQFTASTNMNGNPTVSYTSSDIATYKYLKIAILSTHSVTLNLSLDGVDYTGQTVTLQDGTGTIYTLTESTNGVYRNTAMPNGTYTIYKGGVSTGKTVNINNDINLNFFTVSFNASGGTPTPAAQVVVENGHVTTPATLTKGTDIFGGWYSDSGLSNMWTFATSQVTDTTTLYAKWTTAPSTFIPVTNITHDFVTTVAINSDLPLAGTVAPIDATNQTIVWSVKNANGTGATIANNVFRATTAGTATVTATITDGTAVGTVYTKDFDIIVTGETTYPVTVTGGITNKATAAVGETVTITADAPSVDQQFKEWTGASGLTFTEGSATTATAKFTMPANAVTLTATYETPIMSYTLYYNSQDGYLHIDNESGAEYNTTTYTGSGTTLTLNNFHFKTSAATALVLPDEMTLVLNGTSTVTSTYAGVSSEPSYGIYANSSRAPLVVNGTGSLTATGGNAWQSLSYGLRVNSNGLILTGGCTLNGISGEAMGASVGIHANDITVTDSTLNGRGAWGAISYGVHGFGRITVNGTGVLTGTGGNVVASNEKSYGVYSYYGVTINGSGTLTGTGGTAPYGISCGVYSRTGSVDVTGGMLTATGKEARDASYGVMAENNVSVAITDGTLSATGGEATGNSYGVKVANGVITASGGQLTAKTTSTAGTHQALNKEITLQNGMGAQGSTDNDGANPVLYVATDNNNYNWVQATMPSVVGDFTILGGTLDTDYTYANGVLTITGAKTYTIGMKQNVTSTTHRIVVNTAGAVSLNLNAVTIIAPEEQSALSVTQGSVTLNAIAASSLQGGTVNAQSVADGASGIEGNIVFAGGVLNVLGGEGGDCWTSPGVGGSGGVGINGNLSITGGSLSVIGGKGGNADGGLAGSGGDGISGNATVTSGSLIATGGGTGIGLQASSVGKGVGGTITADASTFAIKAGDSAISTLTTLTTPATSDKKYIVVSLAYTVSFQANGGSAISPITGILSGSLITAPTTPVKTDYDFIGWYKEPQFVTQWNFAVDTVTTNISLYAKWAYNPPVSNNTITGILSGQSFTLGDTVTFTATGGGMDNISPNDGDVRWQPDSWATNPHGDFAGDVFTQNFDTTGMSLGNHTLTITFIKQQYNGTVWETVSPAVTDQKSVNFTLTATSGPVVLPVVEPSEEAPDRIIIVPVGNTTDMSVVATNVTDYQWYRSNDNGVTYLPIPDADQTSYTTPPVTMANDGDRYYCTAINSAGSARSNVFVLKVIEGPHIPVTIDNSMVELWVCMLLITGVGWIVNHYRKHRRKSHTEI